MPKKLTIKQEQKDEETKNDTKESTEESTEKGAEESTKEIKVVKSGDVVKLVPEKKEEEGWIGNHSMNGVPHELH